MQCSARPCHFSHLEIILKTTIPTRVMTTLVPAKTSRIRSREKKRKVGWKPTKPIKKELPPRTITVLLTMTSSFTVMIWSRI